MYLNNASHVPAARGPPALGSYLSAGYQPQRSYAPACPSGPYGAPRDPGGSRGLSGCPHRDAPVQTVEDVISRGYLAVPHSDPVAALLTDRRDTAWLGLDDAIHQVQARQAIYQRNVAGILYATCAATNALHTWKAERGWPSDRQLDNLHKTLQNLYAQEREERVSLWRDVARVRSELPEAAQMYLTAHRKLALLDLPGGGAP